jgi:hypothetical protein
VDAGELVQERFPRSRWALLTGSVVSARRTDGSDLDIVVIVDDDSPDVPYRHSLYFRGWPVELFVHDRDSLHHYLAKDSAERRSAMHRMVAGGAVLHDTTASVGDLQAECAAVLAAGPPPLPQLDLDLIRYRLTDLLDDLKHSRDLGETTVVTSVTWLSLAELACDTARRWRGSGKWIARELHDLDPTFAQ